MLILTRGIGEMITIGHNIRVCVLAIKGTQVRLGMEVPRDLPVVREEIITPPSDKPADEV